MVEHCYRITSSSSTSTHSSLFNTHGYYWTLETCRTSHCFDDQVNYRDLVQPFIQWPSLFFVIDCSFHSFSIKWMNHNNHIQVDEHSSRIENNKRLASHRALLKNYNNQKWFSIIYSISISLVGYYLIIIDIFLLIFFIVVWNINFLFLLFDEHDHGIANNKRISL